MVKMVVTQMEVQGNNDNKEDVPFPPLHTEHQDQFSFNNTLDIEQMNEILQGFYDDFNSETNYILISLYVPVIVLAMTANLMVIVVVFKFSYMRSITNYFVVNLSIADLLVTTICMPMAVSQAVSIIWVYGELMCKLFFYLQGVAVAASVFTITAMSIDRYLAIRSPMAFRKAFNRKNTIIVIVTLWIVAFTIFSPVLRAVTLQSPIIDLDNITLAGQWDSDGSLQVPKPPTFYVCSEDFKPLGIHAHMFGAACFLLVYAVPGFIVIIAYSMMGRTLCARKPPFDCDSIEGSASSQQGFRLVRERRRVAWILLLLAVLFALCWLPYNVLRLLIDFGFVHEGKINSDVLSYCLLLGHANSALNPIVYCFMTRNFRRSVAEILCRNMYSVVRRRSHRKNMGSAVCGGCNSTARTGPYLQKVYHGGSGLGHHSALGLFAPGPLTTQPGSTESTVHAVQLLHPRSMTTVSSSGYDSYHSRHSPHRRCYMLKKLSPDLDTNTRHKAISPAKECNVNGCSSIVANENCQ